MGFATAALVAGLGTLMAHSMESTNQMRRDSEQQARGQKEKQEKLLTEAKQQEKDDVAAEQKAQARSGIRAKQKSRYAQSSGRSGTILTDGLGVPGGEASGQKSLLGM